MNRKISKKIVLTIFVVFSIFIMAMTTSVTQAAGGQLFEPEPTEPSPEDPVEENVVESPEIPPLQTGDNWTLLIDPVTDNELAQVKKIQPGLKSAGFSTAIRSTDRDTNALEVRGVGGLSGIRDLLYTHLDGKLNFIGGAAEVMVHMPQESAQPFTISLESNLSTGYYWNVAEAVSEGAVIKNSSEFNHRGGRGVPQKQTLTFTPAQAGDSYIHLLYQRPFDSGEVITRHLTIELAQPQDTIDLSDPNPTLINTSSASSQENPIAEIPLKGAVPTDWDWRDASVVPGIRDQSTCGSCWAFGTVGVMESAMVINGGSMQDLSEQFLVSCNNNGWDCDGGLTAHKYHYNTKGINQTAIGAVLESDKPYTATNGSCTVAYNHPYKLSGWKFVTGSEWTVPTDDQIKNAIYTYGPITAGICAGSAFDGYSGGIFSTNEYCGGYTNHQIILVGWNDTGGYWILRNSWGTTWGESGYMRIAYGTSRVGEGTSWVSYQVPIPPKVILESPAKKTFTNDTTPELTWFESAGAEDYHVQVSTSSKFDPILQEQDDIAGLGFTTAVLADGKYFWRVQGKNSADVYGLWSAASYFIVDTIPPVAPLLKSPLDGASVVGTPTFTWNKVKDIKLYQFEYNDTDDPDTYIYRSDPNKATKFSPPAMATRTTFYWYVRGQDAAGNWSDWSAPFTISIEPPVPGSPSLIFPANKSATNDNIPTFDWHEVNYDDGGYHILVDDDKKFLSPEIDEYTATGVTEYTDTEALPDGKYYWMVSAANEDDVWGKGSKAAGFEVDTIPPVAPLLKSPLDGASVVGTPTFTWNRVRDIKLYQFEYNDVDDPDTYIYRSDPNKATKFSPPVMGIMTTYYWYVRGQDAAGNWSDWSAPFTMMSTPPVPGSPTLLSPVNGGSTEDNPPTFSWNAVYYDGHGYQIQVDNNSNFSSPEVDDTTVSGVTTYTPASTMDGGKHYWRVRAENLNGDPGNWSRVSYFTLYPSFDTQFNTAGNFEGWQQHPGAAWSVTGGALTTPGLIDWDISSASFSPYNFADFTYSARIRMNTPSSGNTNHYGLVFRGTPDFDPEYNEWRNAYMFDIWQINEGYDTFACYNVLKYVNGSWTGFNGKWWFCYDIINYGTYNTLTVYAKGSNFKFYINDYLMLSKSSSGLTNGRLGVYSYGNETVAYPTYVDWATAGPPQLPGAARQAGSSEAIGYLVVDPDKPFDEAPTFVPLK